MAGSLDDYEKPVERHRFWFQYVTTRTSDTPGTVLLMHFDSKRYMFGRIAEGTQRACVERGIPLSKARNLFLTGETRWENNGGLLGMMLTMADVIEGTKDSEQKALGDVCIHGGPKILHTIACARRFIFRTFTPVNVTEVMPHRWRIQPQGDFRDENVRVWTVPIQKSSSRATSPSRPALVKDNPEAIEEQQALRQKTVHNMFQSDWRKDRLYETPFCDVNLPAVVWRRDPVTKDLTSFPCHAMSDAVGIAPDELVLVRHPWPASTVPILPSAENISPSTSMCYIVKGRPQRGVFQPQKAKAAGVMPGPMYSELAVGKTITLEDGRVIRPEDVLGPTDPAQGMAILDVPDEHYLPDLRDKLQDLGQASVMENVNIFTWNIGHGVAQSRAYQDLLEQYSHVKHIVDSADNVSDHLVMRDSAAGCARLNRIRPDTFLKPRTDEARVVATTETQQITTVAVPGLTMDMAPQFKITPSEIALDMDYETSVSNMSDTTLKLIPDSTLSSISTTPFDDISVTTLGTGSALPSKYRNVSANLVHVPSLGYILLDCGENTLGQLRRLHSPEKLEDILCNLHMIWISHLHADHHLGTMSVLLAYSAAVRRRKEARRTDFVQLYVVSEHDMANYMLDYRSVQRSDAIHLRCLDGELEDATRMPITLQDTSLPLKSLQSCRVSHCKHAQALTLTFNNDFKISYSGDCRPSAEFAEMGKDSDIIIHEATFDDGLEGDARAKKHSTIGEALGVAQAMKAKNVILTHFSQRYQKLPTLSHVKAPERSTTSRGREEEEDAGDDLANATTMVNGEHAYDAIVTKQAQNALQETAKSMPICVAFDGMRVTIPEIKDMYKYFPAIESLFEEEARRGMMNRAAASKQQKQLQEEKAARNRNKRADNEKKSKKQKNRLQSVGSPEKKLKLDDL